MASRDWTSESIRRAYRAKVQMWQAIGAAIALAVLAYLSETDSRFLTAGLVSFAMLCVIAAVALAIDRHQHLKEANLK